MAFDSYDEYEADGDFEGHPFRGNQWSGHISSGKAKSSHAKSLSKKAFEEKTAPAHQEASLAHKNAAESTKNEQKKAYHTKHAEKHDKLAKQLGGISNKPEYKENFKSSITEPSQPSKVVMKNVKEKLEPKTKPKSELKPKLEPKPKSTVTQKTNRVRNMQLGGALLNQQAKNLKELLSNKEQ
jgi:hypothetical protein